MVAVARLTRRGPRRGARARGGGPAAGRRRAARLETPPPLGPRGAEREGRAAAQHAVNLSRRTAGVPWGIGRRPAPLRKTAAMEITNQQIRLAARPSGLPKPGDWGHTTEPVPDPDDGQVVVKTRYLSLDPAM